ncbi:hypothetical protein ACFLWA_12675 [Chloroflexota bacterium]
MTTHQDMLFHLGGLPVMAGLPFSKGAKYYFVDVANGSDGNDGLSPKTPLATLIAAEDLCVANRHDTIFLIGGASGLNMSAALVWDKAYTHLIGICAPTMVAQRARIFQLSTLTGASPLFTVSASGCIFKNFYCFQGVADATSLINWSITGERNYFENVHFAGGGHATQAVNGGASLQLNGGSENTFRRCTIGVDTAAAATGMAGLLLDAEATRNIFKGCHFTMYAGNAGAIFVEVTDATGIDRYTIFDNCLFTNPSATAMSQAFAIPAGMSPPRGPIYLKDCAGHGFTDWDASDRGVLFLNGGTVTAGGTTGLFQASTVA